MKASGSWHRQYQRPSKPKFFGVFLFTKEVLSSSFARSFMPNFIPASFVPPQRLDHAAFLLRPLCIHDVVKDYDAVMTSIDHLQGVFGPGQSWPRPDLTLEQDLIDLGWHQKEFQCRRSFAYTVMALDESRCLGCAYIEPTTRENFDAGSMRCCSKHSVPGSIPRGPSPGSPFLDERRSAVPAFLKPATISAGHARHWRPNLGTTPLRRYRGNG
jgi:hypothetical protein